MAQENEFFSQMKMMNDTRGLLPDEATSALLEHGRELAFKSEIYSNGKTITSLNGGTPVESEMTFKEKPNPFARSGSKGYNETFTDVSPTSTILRNSIGKHGLDPSDPEQKTGKLKQETTIIDENGNPQVELMDCQTKKLEETKFEVNCQGSRYNVEANLKYNFQSKSQIDTKAGTSDAIIELTDPAKLYLGKIEQKITTDLITQKMIVEGKAIPAVVSK